VIRRLRPLDFGRGGFDVRQELYASRKNVLDRRRKPAAPEKDLDKPTLRCKACGVFAM
jgi:hypothetical protein